MYLEKPMCTSAQIKPLKQRSNCAKTDWTKYKLELGAKAETNTAGYITSWDPPPTMEMISNRQPEA